MKKKSTKILIIALAVALAVGGAAAYFLLRDKPVPVNYADMPADLLAAAVGHDGIDESFPTDRYSLVYNNADGTKTMYVYTHPVSYLSTDGQLHIIDNGIVPAESGWSNKANAIKTTLERDKLSASLLEHSVTLSLPPASVAEEPNLADIKTILGNKQRAVQYALDGFTLSAYPTYLGIKCQLDLPAPSSDSLILPLQTNLEVDTQNGFYIQFLDMSYNTAALLYQPIIKDSDGKIFRLPDGLKYADGEVTLDLLSMSAFEDITYPLSLEFTLNMYQRKQADSCVMSGYANDNQYLDNYLYAGYFNEMGEAESLLRFESSLYKTIKADKVISAEYRFSGLNSIKGNTLKLRECDKEWASTHVTWNTRDTYDSVIGEVKSADNNYSCDLTALVKKWITGEMNSHWGFQITGDESDELTEGVIFPSADNGYCSPVLVVNFEG